MPGVEDIRVEEEGEGVGGVEEIRVEEEGEGVAEIEEIGVEEEVEEVTEIEENGVEEEVEEVTEIEENGVEEEVEEVTEIEEIGVEEEVEEVAEIEEIGVEEEAEEEMEQRRVVERMEEGEARSAREKMEMRKKLISSYQYLVGILTTIVGFKLGADVHTPFQSDFGACIVYILASTIIFFCHLGQAIRPAFRPHVAATVQEWCLLLATTAVLHILNKAAGLFVLGGLCIWLIYKICRWVSLHYATVMLITKTCLRLISVLAFGIGPLASLAVNHVSPFHLIVLTVCYVICSLLEMLSLVRPTFCPDLRRIVTQFLLIVCFATLIHMLNKPAGVWVAVALTICLACKWIRNLYLRCQAKLRRVIVMTIGALGRTMGSPPVEVELSSSSNV